MAPPDSTVVGRGPRARVRVALAIVVALAGWQVVTGTTERLRLHSRLAAVSWTERLGGTADDRLRRFLGPYMAALRATLEVVPEGGYVLMRPPTVDNLRAVNTLHHVLYPRLTLDVEDAKLREPEGEAPGAEVFHLSLDPAESPGSDRWQLERRGAAFALYRLR